MIDNNCFPLFVPINLSVNKWLAWVKVILQATFFYFGPQITVAFGGITTFGKGLQRCFIHTHFFNIAEVGDEVFKELGVLKKEAHGLVVQVLSTINHIKETPYFAFVKVMFCKVIGYCFIRTDGKRSRNIGQLYPVDGIKDIIVQ